MIRRMRICETERRQPDQCAVRRKGWSVCGPASHVVVVVFYVSCGETSRSQPPSSVTYFVNESLCADWLHVLTSCINVYYAITS